MNKCRRYYKVDYQNKNYLHKNIKEHNCYKVLKKKKKKITIFLFFYSGRYPHFEYNIGDTYIGLSEPPFKDRFRNHKSNFKTRNPKNATSLSKHIWKLQDQNIEHDVSWKIVSRAKPFNHVTNYCQLCTIEKYFIISKPEMASINARNEIAGPCLHKHNKLLKKSKS